MSRRLRRRYGRSRWSDFDLRTEMREGAVIHDARGGGYDVSFVGKHIGHFKSRGAALRAILTTANREGYFPNIFAVNDHGNVTLLSARINERGKVASRHVKSWV